MNARQQRKHDREVQKLWQDVEEDRTTLLATFTVGLTEVSCREAWLHKYETTATDADALRAVTAAIRETCDRAAAATEAALAAIGMPCVAPLTVAPADTQTTIRRPPCQLVGTDGNVFAIIGTVSKTLREDGQPERAAAWVAAATRQTSYDDVLALATSYVDAF